MALDRPSEHVGPSLYLNGMHSVVDRFAYAVWTGDGELRLSLSLSPDSGIIENIGVPLAFEAPYWAVEQRSNGTTASLTRCRSTR